MDTYTKEGTVIELKDTIRFNDYFSKREFKIRFTEADMADRIIEQKWKLSALDAETIEALDNVRIDDQIRVEFYISGTDRAKKDDPSVIMNFTNLVAIHVEVLLSPTRATNADRQAPVTNQAKEYKDPLKEASDEELAGIVKQDDGLLAAWDKKKDKYGLTDEENVAAESMKSKILNKEEDPFSDIKEVGPNGEEIKKLPF